MLFSGEDVAACATLAGAGYRILRDIAEASGQSKSYNGLKSVIRPGMEKEFWVVMNSVPNFLKHADKDPHAILDIDDEWVDLALFQASMIYQDLGFRLTPEMNALCTIVLASYPKFMNVPAEHKAHLEAANRGIAQLSRAEKLALGQQLLAQGGVQGRR